MVAIVIETTLDILRLGAEAVGELVRCVSIDDSVPERIIFEVRSRDAICCKVFAPVAVLGWMIRAGSAEVLPFGQHSTDSARSLQAAAQVRAQQAGDLESGRNAHSP